MKTDWNPVLRGEFDKPYWNELQQFVADERARHTVFPPPDQVFAALHLTPYEATRVVLLGQDPYHGPRQAHGLCFSVQDGVQLPPSLVNIYKELHDDLGIETPKHGNLESWARQGVLMLNTSLTVRAGAAASHQGKGWETFTDEVLRIVNDKPHRVVFILWGSHARKKKALIDTLAPHRDRVRPPVAARARTTASSAANRSAAPTPRSSKPASHRSTGDSPNSDPIRVFPAAASRSSVSVHPGWAGDTPMTRS